MHDRDVVPDRGVVDEVARREVVGAVHDHVPAVLEDALDVLRGQPLAERDDLDVGVQGFDRPARGVGLRLAERVGRVHDLALQVRLVDHVRVDDPELADAGRGQVERGRRAEAARADQQDARVEQPQLPFLADLRDQQVAAVAGRALGPERARQVGREAAVLPVRVAAGERDRALVAELAERLGGEGRAVALRAVEQHRARAVGRDAFDPRLEVAARNVDGAGDAALLPLVALADVHEQRRVLARQQLLRAAGVDLFDRSLGLLEQLAVARHGFQLYSGGLEWPRARRLWSRA